MKVSNMVVFSNVFPYIIRTHSDVLKIYQILNCRLPLIPVPQAKRELWHHVQLNGLHGLVANFVRTWLVKRERKARAWPVRWGRMSSLARPTGKERPRRTAHPSRPPTGAPLSNSARRAALLPSSAAASLLSVGGSSRWRLQ